MSRYAAIAEVEQVTESDFWKPGLLGQIKNWALAVILIPFSFITVITLIQHGGDERFLQGMWYSTEFLCFVVGASSLLSLFLTGVGNTGLLYLYVLGHEMTHATFIYLCGGRISQIHFNSEGGYVVTNKSNLLIALSPYFVPFWSAVVISLHSLVSLWAVIPAGGLILMGLLGFTWTFHIVWTVWMIPKDQPDFQEHGTFLSLMVIVLANLLVLSLMLCAMSSDIKLSAFVFNWWNNVLDLMEASRGWLAGRFSWL